MGTLWFKNHNRSISSDESAYSHLFKGRGCDRLNFEAQIVFEDYEKGTTFNGSVINYSKGGFYIEADEYPEIGTGALVHMSQYSPEAPSPENVEKYYVEVKWVKKTCEENNQSRYGIGVKNCSDIYELFRLFGH